MKAYEAKVAVFRACVSSLEEFLKQFTSGPERHFAEHFANSFIEFWSQALRDAKSAPVLTAPTYSSIVADSATHQPSASGGQNIATPLVPPQQNSRQGQRSHPAPPKDDLGVFIRLPNDAPARSHSGVAIRGHVAKKVGIDQQKIPRVSKIATGWAIHPTGQATHDLLMKRHCEWSEELGATAIEKAQKWFTYIVPECPRRLTDLQSKELDYVTAAREDILCQTGLSPVRVQPSHNDSGDPFTQTLTVSFLEQPSRPWKLFGCSKPARFRKKSNPPNQCETCWGYHPRRDCQRTPRCKRCGQPGHSDEECVASEQCINCLGPHVADMPTCPARPKRTHGMLRRLTVEERSLVRRLGAQMYHQQNKHQSGASTAPTTATESSDAAADPQMEQQSAPVTLAQAETGDSIAPAETPPAPQVRHQKEKEVDELSERTTTPTPSPAASYIMVAAEDEEPMVRQASPKKRRRRATIASP